MTRAETTEEHPFLQAFRGGFYGVLRWHQLDELWQGVSDDTGPWYIYQIGEPPPEAPADAEQLERFKQEIDALLRAEHDEDYCGIVYADDLKAPAFIKIFDPNDLGSSCGSSGAPPLPGWILSTQPPVDLPAAFPRPANRRRWWQRLFG